MLQRLYDLLYIFKDYVVLVICVVLSLIFLALNDNAQVKRIRTIATVVFGSVQNSLRFATSYVGLREENALLRRVNVELADEATQLREARLENYRLRSLLGLKQRSSYRLIAAEVVGKSLTLQRNTLTLNVGRTDGVDALMPVVSDAGLVGVVTAVADRYATVNIVLNTEFRASARIQRSRVDGILGWNGTTLQLRNIAKTMDVMAGDVVQTSAFSNTFPEDIRIGIVSSVEGYPGALFKDVTVTPGVDFVRLEEVFVLVYKADSTRTELENRSLR